MVHPQNPADLVDTNVLRPYAKAIVVRYTGTAPGSIAIQRLRESLAKMHKSKAGREVRIVAEGLTSDEMSLGPDDGDFGGEEAFINAYVVETVRPPAWAIADSPYRETLLSLVMIVWAGDLVAIHCESSLVDRIQNWLDKEPRPPFERLPVEVIHATLLKGEARTLWLQGAHTRRTTKADSKVITGKRLQDALSPTEDGTFAMGSVRVDVTELQPELASLTGVAGTTPRKSLMWFSASKNFDEFLNVLIDLLRAFRRCLTSGELLERPFPWLTSQVRDLARISGAYEITTVAPEELGPDLSGSDEALDAADLLASTTFHIRQIREGSDFVVSVHVDGSEKGQLRGLPIASGDRVRLRFGYEGEPAHRHEVARVLRALLDYPELVTVYYRSGHAIHSGAAWISQVRAQTFPNWEWQEFAGYRVNKEKPGLSQQQIYTDAGAVHDDSLFSWVARQYAREGWLTCDDGSGEVSDFVLIRPDGALELIHVKGAESDNPHRGISAAAYEVVVGQAVKNLVYLNRLFTIEGVVAV